MKTQIDHILTPKMEKHFFQEQLLPPLLRRECTTVFCVPCSGIKTQTQFLLENADSFGFKKLGNYKAVTINPLNLVDSKPENCFGLIYSSLSQNKIIPAASYYLLMELIKKQLREDYHLIFIFEYFDKLNYPTEFFNNLHSFYQIDRRKVHFIFLSSQNILHEQNFLKYGQLFKLMLQNKIYFPLLGKKDALFVAKRLNRKYNFGLAEAKIEEIVSCVGGHPSLLRRSLQLSKNSKVSSEELLRLILSKEEINLILKEIWESLSGEEKQSLVSIAKGGNIEREAISPYLLKMGFVNFKKGSYYLFSPLFNAFVKGQKIEKAPIFINREEGKILVNGQPFKEKITPSECKLLEIFLQKPNEVVSRDKIADALWGKDSFDRYSDWTIDQTIYLIRKRMRKWGIPHQNLQTIKGWGYRWLS
ncbi:MAG: winged helix-turn-helix domain-containing protein [Patescibacteria group bacterium]